MSSSTHSSFFLVLLFLILLQIPSSLANLYNDCSSKQFQCGQISAGFPFWGQGRPRGCGIPELELRCEGNGVVKIVLNRVEYIVLGINDELVTIARKDVLEQGIPCPPQPLNSTFDPNIFEYAPGYTNMTFIYGCVVESEAGGGGVPFARLPFTCQINGAVSPTGYAVLGDVGPGTCYRSIFLPVSGTGLESLIVNLDAFESTLKRGFQMKWKVDSGACGMCTESKGACGYDLIYNQTTCYCPNQSGGGSNSKTCSSSSSPSQTPTSIPVPESNSKTTLGIGLGIAGLAVIGGLVGGCFVIIKRKRKSLQAQSKGFQAPPSSKGLLTASTGFSSTTPSYPSSRTTDLEKGSAYFGVTMFTYIELEEATNNFDSANQLGDGGFGIVYYGLLKDGRNVAVKRLYENNVKRAEQFMNEIEILTRLRHKNLVTLYGCTSRRSQELLLVYEYIANGTVADHVHGKHSNSGLLTWPVRLSIAIETADALAFLHASDVIHRDVKTNNILLGTNFQVKVADFGLSRLFPNDVTHVSTAPQGTPGYVDPEYYQCYQLTDKSDVYSFGVVLVELISSLQAVDTNRHRHDINLSNMAVNKIQNHELQELVDPSLGFDSDYAVKTMVTSVAGVAFRCLQQEREMRPKMEEVLKDLRRIESEYYGAGKAEVVDIREDAGLLKNVPPPLSFSPDSITDKWATGSPKTTPSSY